LIRVEKANEPLSFNERVRIPGLRVIAEMVGEKPQRTAGKRFKKIADQRDDIPAKEFPPYWTEALNDLMEAYDWTCAYSCFRIHPVTGRRSVDHFAAKSRQWEKVYEWSNYRLASSLLNARKNDFGDVLDPFEIVDGWFQLELVGFQVLPDPTLKHAIRERVQRTIDRLGLNDFRRARERDAENYWSGEISWRVLSEESPFVAKELRRQGRLNTGYV
jgi:hypothetical protein